MPPAPNACGSCVNFDPVLPSDDARRGRHGWCAAKSTYPAREQQGQTFPAGVKRVPEGTLAKPVIVRRDEVVANCAFFQAKPLVTSTKKK